MASRNKIIILIFLFFFFSPLPVFSATFTYWLDAVKNYQNGVSAGNPPNCRTNQDFNNGTPRVWWEDDGNPASGSCYYTFASSYISCTSGCGFITAAQMPLTWDATFGNFHNNDYSRWTLAGGYIDINYFDDQAVKMNGFILSGTGVVGGVPASDLPLKDIRCAVMGIHLQSEYGGSGGAGLSCFADGASSGTTYQYQIPLLPQSTDANIAAFFAKQRADGTTAYDMKDMANRTFLETVIGWGGTAKTVIERETTKWGVREVLADGSIRLEFNSDTASGGAFETSTDMQNKLVAEVPGLLVNTTGLLTADGSTIQTQALVGAMRQLNNTVSSFNGGAGPGEPVKFQVTTGQTDTHVPGAAQTDATTVTAIGTMTGNNYGDIIALGKPVTAQTALDSVNSANAKFGGTVSRQFEYTGSNAPTTTVSNTPPSSSGSGSSGAGLPTGNASVPSSSGSGVGSTGTGSSSGDSLYTSRYADIAPGGDLADKMSVIFSNQVSAMESIPIIASLDNLVPQFSGGDIPIWCFYFGERFGGTRCLDPEKIRPLFDFFGVLIMITAGFTAFRIIIGD